MQLTVGPTQFFWRGEAWRDFYARLADEAPVDRVVLGELVCSKRLPFYQTEIPQAVERLQAAGKQVVLTSLALITLKRERKLMADLADMGLEVEINDLTALAYLPKGTAFSVGPLINTYNEGTAAWMHKRGAARICLPPELPLASVRAITAASLAPVEVWGWGRLPLAISGRCYHARLHDRTKDNCQFICDADPDGREVETLDGQDFLAVNGVQTLSAACANAAYQVPALRDAGVSSLRLSPQSEGFAELCGDFRALLDGRITAGELSQRALPHAPGGTYCDGFLTGDTGAAWSQAGRESA